MLFNSLQFAVFFVIVYSLYLVLDHKWQNRMLLAASCIFYGAWSWAFLCLMFVSITTDYICGIKIYESNNQKKRKLFLVINIIINLGILGFFKYFNFFISNVDGLFGLFGVHLDIRLLNIVLPVGISFYTFQAMSYAFDIYRRELEPTRNYLDYALFVTYFPQLVAGPIMRARDLLPQVVLPRRIRLDWFYEGFYLIFWGLFEKVFIADNLARIVDPVFAASGPYKGSEVLLASYAFAFQIFCDFDGYSNIARGLGRCMGFDIMINFNLPYFAKNPREFWQRWHISLSTWLRDYLYVPLGGNRKGTMNTYRNLAITMFLGGLWHGAAWTFVLWGVYHGLLLIAHRAMSPVLSRLPAIKNAAARNIWSVMKIAFFFNLVCQGWIMFRAESLAQLCGMVRSVFAGFQMTPSAAVILKDMSCFIIVLLAVQIVQYIKGDLCFMLKWPGLPRAAFYTVILCFVAHNLFYGKYSWIDNGRQFIYFQF